MRNAPLSVREKLYNEQSCFSGEGCITHRHPAPPDFWPAGCRPLAFTHFRSKHAQAHRRDQTGTTDGERNGSKRGQSERLESYERGPDAGTWRGECAVVRGEREREREEPVVTPAGVWRACSLRRTSRRCCRTLCPSGGLLEPCSHECPWNTPHTDTYTPQSASAVAQQSHTLNPRLDGRMRGAKPSPHPPVWKTVASTVTKLLWSDIIRP